MMNDQLLNTVLSMVATSPFTMFLLYLWYTERIEARRVQSEYTEYLKLRADKPSEDAP